MPVKVNYTPPREVFVHDLREHPIEEFLHTYISPRTERIGWAGEYLLSFSHFGSSEYLIKQAIEGEEHIACIDYARYGRYTPTVRNPELNIEVLVVNQSKDRIIKEIVKLIELEEAKKKVG